MRVIDVIENYCECRIQSVAAGLRGGRTFLYGKDGDAPFSLSVNRGGIGVEIKYSAKSEMTPDKAKFAGEMIGCLLENRESWSLHEELSKVAENSAGSEDLDELLRQILNTIICSHLFDKAAVMFCNPKKSELRAVQIAGIPPYTEEQAEYFKTVRIPFTEETLNAFSEGGQAASGDVGTVFERIDKKRLKNSLIISPLKTGRKLYGFLVTYAETPYGEKHIHASISTARFITATMAATIVYKQYALSLASEKQMASQIKNDENLLALGNYAAAIAHEIKNPLISIGGFAKRLMKAINDPSLQKMANIISTESERLERLTEDILSFSKKHEPDKTPVPLLEEMENIKSLFDLRSQETGIDIILRIPESAVINVDRNQFRQVTVNLIANAMTAIGTDGAVTVSLEEKERFYVIIIADTGSGIPEENLPKLFKPFFTTSSKGTGLGLAISKKIMTNHGGDITVRNGGRGAEFSLLVPKP